MKVTKEGKKALELNSEQKEALKLLLKTFHGVGFSTFSASAGCGKSTVLLEFIDQLIHEKIDPASICVAVPTHKLAGEWRTSLEGSGVEIRTVHSLMRFFPDVDEKGERPLRKMNKDTDDADILPYDILIVDEAYMLPKQVVQAIYSHGYLSVVLTGDPGQTLPIGESCSEILNLEDISFKILLSQNMRQKDKELKEIVDAIEFQGAKYNPTRTPRASFQKEFFQSVQDHPEDTLYLAYRNETCRKMSDMIRSIQGVENLDFVEIGEMLKIKSLMKGPRVLLPANTIVKVVKIHSKTNAFDIEYNGLTYLTRIDLKGEVRKSLEKVQRNNTKEEWRKHYKLCDSFLNFFHPSVSTVHSSQGMTVKNVFLDWPDIQKCKNDPNLAYVAASRASEKLIFG